MSNSTSQNCQEQSRSETAPFCQRAVHLRPRSTRPLSPSVTGRIRTATAPPPPPYSLLPDSSIQPANQPQGAHGPPSQVIETHREVAVWTVPDLGPASSSEDELATELSGIGIGEEASSESDDDWHSSTWGLSDGEQLPAATEHSLARSSEHNTMEHNTTGSGLRSNQYTTRRTVHPARGSGERTTERTIPRLPDCNPTTSTRHTTQGTYQQTPERTLNQATSAEASDSEESYDSIPVHPNDRERIAALGWVIPDSPRRTITSRRGGPAWYVVSRAQRTGIFEDWNVCASYLKGVSNIHRGYEDWGSAWCAWACCCMDGNIRGPISSRSVVGMVAFPDDVQQPTPPPTIFLGGPPPVPGRVQLPSTPNHSYRGSGSTAAVHNANHPRHSGRHSAPRSSRRDRLY